MRNRADYFELVDSGRRDRRALEKKKTKTSDRIERLEPDIRAGGFLLPGCVVHHPIAAAE